MRYLAMLIAAIQSVAAIRVFGRMARTARGTRILKATDGTGGGERVSVIVPVLNEEERLPPCLAGLVKQGPEVVEILIIDGGSTDNTHALAREWAGRDERIRLIDAGQIPAGANGKAHGLAAGYAHASSKTAWILTIDADVRPGPNLVPSLLAHAEKENVEALSVATQQELSGAAEGLVHPSMLSTLVYRFGIPGHATTNPHRVQANGQCCFVHREALDKAGGFASVLYENAEDVTLGRLIAMQGTPVGFYESDDLVHVEMYTGWRDAWDNWSRSLPMRDRFTGVSSAVALSEATLVQGLPLWLVPLFASTLGRRHLATLLNAGLVVARMGVLAGMARAYRDIPWTYWLSPLADIGVLARIWQMWSRRIHTWRGRTLVAGERT